MKTEVTTGGYWSGVKPGDSLSQEPGFTRLDLLVGLAVLTVLGLMLLPALARTRTDSRVFQCLKNVRELTRAWRMYCDDSQDWLPYAAPNLDPASAQYAWVAGSMDYNPNNPSNWDVNVDIMESPLWKYCGTNAALWKCPADPSYVVVNGVARPRVRSFAMNVYFGGWAYTDGGWGWAQTWKFFSKSSHFSPKSPARLFVIQDVREDHRNDGVFATKMDGYSETAPNGALYGFFDRPGARHEGGTTFSFADGRAEFHRWTDPRTVPPLSFNGQVDDSDSSPRNADVAWLQQRSTRPK